MKPGQRQRNLNWDAGDGIADAGGGGGADILVVTGSAVDEFLGATTRAGLVTFTRALRDPFDAGTRRSLDDVQATGCGPSAVTTRSVSAT